MKTLENTPHLEFNVLSIDAWAGCEENQWEWNTWHKVDEYHELENGQLNEKNALKFFFLSLGYRGPFYKFSALYSIEDDQYNLVLIENKTMRPLYAIEYGNII